MNISAMAQDLGNSFSKEALEKGSIEGGSSVEDAVLLPSQTPERIAAFDKAIANQPLLDLSASSSLSKGAAYASGLVETVYTKMMAAIPEVGDLAADSDSAMLGSAVTVLLGGLLTSAVSPDKQKSIEEATADYEHFKSLSIDERETMIVESTKDKLLPYYADVVGRPGMEVLGAIGKELVDPVTLMIPVGKTFKTGASIGAMDAGVNETLKQSLGEGNYDAKTIAYHMAGGAIIGGALAKGGKILSDWMDSRVTEGLPVDEAGVAEALKTAGVKVSEVNLTELTSAINKEFKLSTETALSRAIKDANNLKKGGVSNRTAEELAVSLPPNTSQGEAMRNLAEAEAPGLNSLYADQQPKGWAKASVDSEGNLNVNFPEGDSGVVVKSSRGNPSMSAKRVEELGKFPFGDTNVHSGTDFGKVYQELGLEPPESLYKAYSLLDEALPTASDEKGMKELIEAMGGPKTDKFPDAKSPRDAAKQAMIHKEIPINSPMGKKMYTEVGMMIDDTAKELSPADAERLMQAARNTKMWTTSQHWFNQLGPVGREVGERIRRSFEEASHQLGDSLYGVNKLMRLTVKKSELSEDVIRRQLTDVMRNPKANVAPEVRSMAKYVRRKFNKMLDDAVDTRILKKADAERMKIESKEQGWFPRIYRNDYLNTKEGQEAWVEKMTSYKWSPEAIEKAAKSIDGKARREVRGITQNKDGSWKVDRDFARRALKRQLTNDISLSTNAKGAINVTRSSHLEKGRKIDLPDEMLQDFLVNDSLLVMERYFADSYRRIAFSKYFGKNDEFLAEAVRKVDEATQEAGIGEHMLRLYRHSVRDAAEPAVAETMRIMRAPSRGEKVALTLNSLATLKLALASLLNITQATVFGITQAVRMTDDFSKGFILAGKAWKETIAHPVKSFEYAQRIGAATQQTIMQISGEMSSDLTQRMQGLFLKGTGYQFVEQVQRTLASNMGKAHAEDLIASKIKLAAKIAKQGPGTELVKQMKRIDNQLDELGLDASLNPSDITVKDMDRAAQRFSNMVNFVRDADQLPTAWQHPYGVIVTKFKSFAYWSGKFMYVNVGAPAVKFMKTKGKEGSLKPFFAFAIAAQVALPTTMLREWIKSESTGEPYKGPMPKDFESTVKSMMMAYGNVGALGLYGSMAKDAVMYGDTRAAGQLVGPVIGSGVEAITHGLMGIKAAAEGDGRGALNEIGKVGTTYLPPITDKLVEKELLTKPKYITPGY
jgi:hypothetical protein